ncbi:HAD-IIIA family hydrolase [Butyrivibrio fibrisolvens]|uniref:HAD-IIIA family hydrolase n=1 Tax=Butyrivibrio fibrisolvens TaxID=831 RepID=UPI0003B60BFC|nr:HAD-IIIA family hydrolase [Butyrivibrio fibrisolvens]
MKIVIMAGGKGTRIASVAHDIPKPMIPINGKPVLEREIECLKSQGLTDIILTVSHMADVIIDYFGDGTALGVNITYYVEKEPLGNAGALFRLRNILKASTSDDDSFLLLNADSIFDIDFHRFIAWHKEKKARVSLFTHPNSHPYDSGLVITDNTGAVTKWLAKEDERPRYYKNRVNAGLHIMSVSVLDSYMDSLKDDQKKTWNPAEDGLDEKTYGKPIIPIGKVDLDRALLKPLSGTGKMYAYDSPEYVKDMGTPDRYYAVCRDYETGKVKARNLSNKQKAIFLDRDGTINKYVGFLRNIDDFELLPGVTDAIKRINNSGYLAIVVTNQPVIARGEVTYQELCEIHNKMETLLGAEGAYLDAIYFCPHHPHKGYEGEVRDLKIECECRKPKPGMLLTAAKDFNIDLSESWMIGDGENDMLAGRNGGTKVAYIKNDLSLKQDTMPEADLIGDSLIEIINSILG